jgi:hypothetical protein
MLSPVNKFITVALIVMCPFVKIRSAMATPVTLSSESNWVQGLCVGTNPLRNFGQLELASKCGISGDTFDQPFIKSIWEIDSSTNYSQTSSGLWAIGEYPGAGLTSCYKALDGATIYAYATIGPMSNQGAGCLYLNSAPWGQNFYGIAVTRTSAGLAAVIVSGTSVTRSIPYNSSIASLDVCITFSASANTRVYTYFRSTGTAQWQPLTTTAGAWNFVDSSNLTLAPVNFSLCLGIPAGAPLTGTATYSNFQVLPYTSSGTWTSAPIDLGGAPSRAPLLSWVADVSPTCTVQIQSRESSDGSSWGAWSDPYASPNQLPLVGTPQRYVQLLASLASSDPSGNSTPVLHSITLDVQDFGQASLLDASNVKVLPNPIKGDSAVVQWLLSSPAKNVRLEFSGPGRPQLLVVDGPGSMGLNSYSLDCRDLANDVYFVRVRALGLDGREFDVVKKLLVSR